MELVVNERLVNNTALIESLKRPTCKAKSLVLLKDAFSPPNELEVFLRLLPDAFPFDSPLSQLTLQHQPLATTFQCSALASVLSHPHSPFRLLTLKSNTLTLCPQLTSVLTNHECKLQSLTISDNFISASAFQALLQAVQSAPHLVALHLNRTHLEENSALLLANTMPSLTHLQSLSLSGDALSPVVISQFAANLVESAHITDFSLASSQMGVLGMRALLSGGFPPHLKCLSLAGNKLNAAAISLFSKSLGDSSFRQVHLRRLDLSHNLLQDKNGILALVQGVERAAFPLLDWLSLSGNRLDSACISILSRLVSKGKVRELELAFNECGNLGAEKLIRALQDRSCRLESLSYTCNVIPNMTCRRLGRWVVLSKLRQVMILLVSFRQRRSESFAYFLPPELWRLLVGMLL